MLLNRANPANGFFFNALSARARELGLQLERIEIDHVGELDAALVRVKGAPLLIIGDPMFIRERTRIAELSIAHRVPGIFGAREYVAAGGLMFYNSSYAWHWRTAAGFVDKILKGAKPGDMPVQQPTQFELVINLKTAKAIGITIPQGAAAARRRGDPVMRRRFIVAAAAPVLAARRLRSRRQPQASGESPSSASARQRPPSTCGRSSGPGCAISVGSKATT